ncbi:hypothetical protein H6F32_11085 [Anabaena sp. FACHB-1237]|uniref:hypothetical protein n=1 Tax=Anabaena sp. FACHB-1237 TaxID=2692769 RepID=UPI0016804CBF|nr:hypothetical protein [Anabaena sp. FACHB-1237]MBD2138120.1 hypothetical protein [Anabaena sp. FACHB-1237]
MMQKYTLWTLMVLFSLIFQQNLTIAAEKNQVVNNSQKIAQQKANSQPHPVFKSILPKLKQTTKIKIFLPTYIPESDRPNPIYAILETVSKDKYEILLGFSPDCSGGSACRLGMITAEAVTAKTPKLTGKSILLRKGITSYFIESRCGANCSDGTLSWREKGVQYSVGIKAGDRNTLIKIAKSVVTP